MKILEKVRISNRGFIPGSIQNKSIFQYKKSPAIHSLLALLLLLGVSTFSNANTDVLVGDYSANITRTAWEMKRSDSVQTLGFNLVSLEDTDAYILADIPDDDETWEHATDTSVIGFKERSRITGTDGNNGCKSAVDYTYFQTYVNIPAGVEVTDFSINFSGIDEGARVSIFNSDRVDEANALVDDSYVFLDTKKQYPDGQMIDLTAYLTNGLNRVVVTQVDNCPAKHFGNLLKSAEVFVDGIEVITAESFLLQAISSANTSDPGQQDIITILARIYGIPGDQIPALEVLTSDSCEGGVIGGDTDGDGLPDGEIIIYDDLILNDNAINLLEEGLLNEHGDAFLKGTVTNPDYLPLRYMAVRVKSASGAVVGELSSCVVAGPDNDSWVRAAPITLTEDLNSTVSTGDVTGYIDVPGIARWYKFSILPGASANIDLSNLPADYDIAVFKDITQSFVELAGSSDTDGLNRLGAEFAPSMFSPSMFSPSMFSPSMFSPSMFSPSMFSPSMFSPSMFSPSMFSPSMFSPSMFSPSMFSPSMFSPSMFSPSMFSPSMFSPSMFSPSMFSEDNYASAQIRSLITVSAQAGTVSERVIADTWNNTGDFYIRVTGKNGVFDLDQEFKLSVTLDGVSCQGINPNLGDIDPATILADNAGYKTIILMDSLKYDVLTLLPKLETLAGEVGGVIVDLADYSHIQSLHTQADDNPSCPYAENLTAQAVKVVIDAYREVGNPLQYVVIAGGDNVIPFFRYPDQGMLGPEQNYEPPMRDGTQSQSSLRLNYILGQDEYGSSTTLSLNNDSFPVPDLAVGRLVETVDEMVTVIDAYLDNGGIIQANSTLVTGYDFLSDVADAIQTEFKLGTSGARNDSLITDADVSPDEVCEGSPNNRCSWTADQLTHELLDPNDGGEDIIFLAGHFSANSALAADYQSSALVTQLAESTVNLTNSLVFSAGCHAGYNIVDDDIVEGLTLPLDWTQAFAQKGATLIAGTGYQYGDTDFIEYSERLYLLFARQLRTGNGAVSVGEALVKAKQHYLSTTPDIRGLHRKSILISTLFGLPMLSIDLDGERITADTGSSLQTTAVNTGTPGSKLGLETATISLSFNLGSHNVTLSTIDDCSYTADTNIEDCPSITATYLSGLDGIITNPAEPALPLETVDVSVDNMSLRGVGFRGGSWRETKVIPFTGAPATEIRGVHTPFSSLVNFPMQLATPNYYGAITKSGGTNLHVTPAQHRVEIEDLGSSDATLRQFDDMSFKLFYSNDTAVHGDNQPALVGPPSMTRVKAVSDGDNITFFVNVVGAPSAGIQEVWVTYSDGLLSEDSWQSVDLIQNEFDTTLWTGTLTGGASIGRLDYMVQSVNGVGLVSVDDNYGTYYHLGNSGVGISNLSLSSLLSELPYGDTLTYLSADLTATDDEGNETPVADAPVLFSIGSVTRIAWTNSSGSASVHLPLNLTPPGVHRLNAYFPGNDDLQVASSEQIFTVTKVNSQINFENPAQVIRIDNESYGFNVNLKDAHANPLLQRTVYFTISDGVNDEVIVPVITDKTGAATLDAGSLTLPVGSYSVTAQFLGMIQLANGNTHYVDSPLYNASSAIHQFDIEKVDTALSLFGPDTVRADQEVNGFTAILTDDNNNPLVGRTVNFSIGNMIGSAITDSTGIARFDFQTPLSAGSYSVFAEFNGDESTYNGSNASHSVIVEKVDTSLSLNGLTVIRADQNVNGFTVTLTDDNNKPLVGQTVNFSIGSINGSAVTNNLGNAIFDTDQLLPADTYTVRAEYAGNDSVYNGSSNSHTVKIEIVTTKLTITGPVTVRADQVVNGFIATLTDDNDQPLADRIVNFSIGSITGSIATDSSGEATFNTNLLLTATGYTVSASFSGDDTTYSGSAVDHSVAVVKVMTTLSLSGPETVRADLEVNGFVATLTDDLNRPLPGRSVNFSIGNITGSVTTDSFGVARFDTNELLAAATYSVVADFTGDLFTYSGSRAEQSLMVKKVNTKVILTLPDEVSASQLVNGFTAILTDDNDQPLQGFNLNFTVGNITGSSVTDNSGMAVFDTNQLLSAGSYSVVAKFSGNTSTYNTSFDFELLAVSKEVSTLILTAGNQTVGVEGIDSVVSATLTDEQGVGLIGYPVIFTIGDIVRTVFTDDAGLADPGELALPPGTYNVLANFAGDSTYLDDNDTLGIDIGSGNKCPTADTKGKITITGYCYLNYRVDGKVAIRNGTLVINSFVNQKVEQFGDGSVVITDSGTVRGMVVESGAGDVEVFGTVGDSGKVGGQIIESGDGDVKVHADGFVYGNISEEDVGSVVISGTVEGNVFESGAGFVDILSGGLVTGGVQQDLLN